MTTRTPKYSPEVRVRAVRIVFEHQNEHASHYAAIRAIAEKIGCAGETLRHWVRQAERDQGLRAGPNLHGVRLRSGSEIDEQGDEDQQGIAEEAQQAEAERESLSDAGGDLRSARITRHSLAEL